MKNAHGVEPTRFMKRKESDCAIYCYPYDGPIFGNYIRFGDLMIVDHCNQENCCYIPNNGTNSYECHPEYRSSLFVNTAGTDEYNHFSVLDYEVYTH